MNTGASLLAAIRAHPAEDTPRLVYADWLEEQGGAADAGRARLIRLMCADPEIRARYNKGRWRVVPQGALGTDRAVLRGLLGAVSFVETVVHRGFLSEIALTLDAFIDSAGAVFGAHPIERVTLSDRRPLGYGSGPWFWYASFDTENGDLPPMTPRPHWVGDVLGGRLAGGSIDPRWRHVRQYDTRAAALDALGAACLAHGRALADQPVG